MERFADAEAFELVGYRFTKLIVDEEPLKDIKGEIDLTIEVKAGYKDRDITQKTNVSQIEELQIEMVITPINKLSPSAGLLPVIHAIVIGGFKSQEVLNAKDQQDKFRSIADYYVRGLYWLARQRVTSLLTMTKLRALPIDWDINPKTMLLASKSMPSARKVGVKKRAKSTR
jgi:hypothetical protein